MKIARAPRLIAFLVVAVAVAGCARTEGDELPPSIAELIGRLEASPKSNPPGAIYRYRYKDRVVFYLPPTCCDVPSELYDSDGNVMCSPDGGITGAGDGRCPDFYEERTDELRVWHDARP